MNSIESLPVSSLHCGEKTQRKVGCLLTIGLLTAFCANATIIAEHSGATNPATEGFVVPPGYNSGHGAPVYNDLGLGINAWNINGVWCCSGEVFEFTAADQAELSTTDWVLTVKMRDLSTASSGSYGPNSYGGGVTVGFEGVRFSVDIHSDGHGDQVLAPDPFAAGPTYTIAGLGTNYALFQVAYDPATKTADYYVNGAEVLSGIKGYTNYYAPWLFFGDEDSNFNLVELQTGVTIPSSVVPEPSTWALFGIGCVVAGTFARRKLACRA